MTEDSSGTTFVGSGSGLLQMKTEASPFMQTNKELLVCTVETALSGDRGADIMVQNTLQVYLEFPFNIEKNS